MSNPPPEKEAPVHLRPSVQLSVGLPQDGPPAGAGASGPLAAQAPQAGADEESLPIPAVAATGLALLLAGGWILQRRQRVARQPDVAAAPPAVADPAPPPAAPQQELLEKEPPQQEPPPPAPTAPPVDMMAQVAAELAGEPDTLEPRQTFPAPLERNDRPSHLLGVPAQKRLIKWLMWLRTVAGGAAILAAIAIVVFWAIEAIDRRSGETGLTRPLLVLLLAGWAASWGSGQLANHLHRVFFGRVHPKFDD